jgi:hypothetical protein
VAEDRQRSVEMSQTAAIQEVARLLKKMSTKEDYGDIVVHIEAGKPVWVEAHPKIRKRVG